MEKIKILALTTKTGVSYHRVYKPMVSLMLEYPEEFDVVFFEVKNKDISSLPKLNEYKFDFIYFNTILGIDDGSPLLYYLEYVLSSGAKIVLDIDDNFNFGRSVIVKRSTMEKHKEAIPEAIKTADYVTTTTDTYKKILLNYNRNVFVFPNFADDKDPNYITNKTKSDVIRIGVTGSVMHKYDMRILRGIPYRLKRDGLIKNVQFVQCGYNDNPYYHEYEKIITDDYRIVSNKYRRFLLDNKNITDVEWHGEPYKRIGWIDPTEYIKIYNELDVLLAPLEDTAFNSAKSQIKYIEAGYMNTLFIGSDVPSYNKYVKHGETGFLCKNNEEFYIVLKDVIRNWDETNGFEYQRNEAKRHIEEEYIMSVVTKQRREFFKKIHNGEI